MTVRELYDDLKKMDESYLDYQLWYEPAGCENIMFIRNVSVAPYSEQIILMETMLRTMLPNP